MLVIIIIIVTEKLNSAEFKFQCYKHGCIKPNLVVLCVSMLNLQRSYRPMITQDNWIGTNIFDFNASKAAGWAFPNGNEKQRSISQLFEAKQFEYLLFPLNSRGKLFI